MLKVYSSLRKNFYISMAKREVRLDMPTNNVRIHYWEIYRQTKDNLRTMKDKYHNKSMKLEDTQRWPLISASHRGAYADCLNTDKYIQATALNTVIYGKKLKWISIVTGKHLLEATFEVLSVSLIYCVYCLSLFSNCLWSVWLSVIYVFLTLFVCFIGVASHGAMLM